MKIYRTTAKHYIADGKLEAVGFGGGKGIEDRVTLYCGPYRVQLSLDDIAWINRSIPGPKPLGPVENIGSVKP